MDSSGEDSTQLACSCVVLILRLGLLDSAFWAAIAEDDSFARVLTKMCVLDDTKSFREHVTGLLEDSVIKESGFPKQDGQMTKYFWFWAIDVVRGASSLGDKCHEVMRITFFLIMQIYPARSFIMDLKVLSRQLSELLANHITAEVSMAVKRLAPVTNEIAEHQSSCSMGHGGILLDKSAPCVFDDGWARRGTFAKVWSSTACKGPH